MNALIRWSLQNRWLVAFGAVALFVLGVIEIARMPLDVFPELRAPTVTVMTEAPGYAAEEVEISVSFPVETALNGIPGIRRVRSSSAIGLSIVWAEFDFDVDIYRARQLVSERLGQARENLPDNIHPPEMTPVTSITGEVMLIALSSPDGSVEELELRRVAEYDLRTRLLAAQGVAQVVAIGGRLPEFQVRVRPEALERFGLTLGQVEDAVAAAHAPAAGGYLSDVEGLELPIRPLTRAQNAGDLAATVVGEWSGTPVTLDRVADVGLGGALRRGAASVDGHDAVILSVQKNPGVNTLELTERLDRIFDAFEQTLPDGIALDRHVFRQSDFIEVAVENVESTVRDGVIFVAIILFLFLLNFRTTFVTLTALPLSIGAALVVLDWYGATINVMTLGGIAVAIGSLVDDAIVDVENVFRRLRENAELPEAQRQSALRVVYEGSVEVRSVILISTVVVVLVFVPLFFLSGIEGRFFRPLGMAYVVALIASTVVAMTVTPVLCYFLLGHAKIIDRPEGRLIRTLKRWYDGALAVCLRQKAALIGFSLALVVGAGALGATYGSAFLPEFDEGSITLFLNAQPGTSLAESNRVAQQIERRVAKLEGVAAIGRRTGRAERDEHAEPPSTSEVEVRLERGADAEKVRRGLVAIAGDTPGITMQLGGPIAHRLSHILSGTPAAVAIKVFGDDLPTLRTIAKEIDVELSALPGVRDLVANREVTSDTLPIAFDRRKLAHHGLTPGAAAAQIETAFRGRSVGAIFLGGARYDVTVRLTEEARLTPEDVGQFLLRTPGGGMVRVEEVGELYLERASNLITRENVKRKAVVSCNVDEGANLGDLVQQIRDRVDPIVARYPGAFVEYGGQFEAQEEASRRIGWASLAVLVLIVVVLHASYQSMRPVLLVLLNLPLALVGGVVAMFIADSPSVFGNVAGLLGAGEYVPPVLSIASLVGFVGLGGMACRNGLLLVSHFYHLLEEEGVPHGEAVVRAARERLVPILMTALTSALALIPLVMAKGEMGSELQYPLAVVILGGLVSSTFLNLGVIPVGLALFARPRNLDQRDAWSDDAPSVSNTGNETEETS